MPSVFVLNLVPPMSSVTTSCASASVRSIIVLVLAGIFAACAPPAHAQEQQVPIDQDSTLYRIDADLRDNLGLFPDVAGFQEATLYRLGDGTFELVIEYREGSRTLRERRALTGADVATLRERVTRRMREVGATPDLNQEGRYGLLASTTYLSAIEGALLSVALGVEDEAAASMTLLGGATGFFAPLLLTRKANVTEGEADMTFYGGAQGAVHGAQLYLLISDDDDVDDEQAAAGITAAFLAGESILAYSLARRNGWSGGHAEMMSFTGLSGNLIGLGLAQGLAGEDGSTRVLAGLSFAGSIAGGIIGHRLGRTGRYTQGDARVYLLSGAQTANAVGSVLAASNVDGSSGPALAVTLAGTGGLALGHLLVRNRDFTKSQGNIVVLGSFAGSLFGGGLAVASDASSDAAVLLQAVGSLAGTALTYGVFAGDAKRQARRNQSSVDLDVRVTPTTESLTGPDGRRIRLSDTIVPKVTLTARF